MCYSRIQIFFSLSIWEAIFKILIYLNEIFKDALVDSQAHQITKFYALEILRWKNKKIQNSSFINSGSLKGFWGMHYKDSLTHFCILYIKAFKKIHKVFTDFKMLHETCSPTFINSIYKIPNVLILQIFDPFSSIKLKFLKTYSYIVFQNFNHST